MVAGSVSLGARSEHLHNTNMVADKTSVTITQEAIMILTGNTKYQGISVTICVLKIFQYCYHDCHLQTTRPEGGYIC